MNQGSGLIKTPLFRRYKPSRENADNFAKNLVQICPVILIKSHRKFNEIDSQLI